MFATVALGRIQGVSVLDLDGIRAPDRPASVLHRALLGLTSLQATGVIGS